MASGIGPETVTDVDWTCGFGISAADYLLSGGRFMLLDRPPLHVC